ncbi:hypothetical protein [Serratia bockelmannii]|uniref:hypothetical protein n=1 Tax=Serratia bockelmannii TaxID=2703793 RepID=UPI00367FD371
MFMKLMVRDFVSAASCGRLSLPEIKSSSDVVRIPQLSKEERHALSVKLFNNRRNRVVEEDFDVAE